MFEVKTITNNTVSSLEGSIKKFFNEKQPKDFSLSSFYDADSNSSSKYTAIIVYKT